MPDPYADLTDEQLLARAAQVLREASGLPVGSAARAARWAAYDAAKAALDLRLLAHVARQLRERDGG